MGNQWVESGVLADDVEERGRLFAGHALGNQTRTVTLAHPQRANKEAGANDGQQVRTHTKADVESSGTKQKKGLWHEGDTSNDTFLKAVPGYR